ncbi:MAG: hypothetical protein JO138_13160 [Acidobacteriaceae bacterium]|nr:hypothetical protein [Acidobacteriaceae bacterium]
MALFTDAGAVSLDDLLQFETSLVQVASSHGINVDTKIKLASETIGDKLLLWLLDVGASDPQFVQRRVLGLSTVVLTAPLQRWICFESLSRFFAEAYNVQLNTRFQGKWTEYEAESAQAEQMLFMSGVGIVYAALPRPVMPSVLVEGGNLPAQAIFVQSAWVDAAGNEGALSPVNGLVLPAQSSIAVSMPGSSAYFPAAAVGWNVYVSSSEVDLTRQNLTPRPVGSIWYSPSTGIVDGPDPVGGQTPQFYITLSKQIKRG